MPPAAAAVLCLSAILVAVGLARLVKASTGMKTLIWAVLVVVIGIMMTLMFTPEGEGMFSVPELKGLRFVGGISIPIELIAMIISIVLYGSAYIAEVVRGGLEEVPKGLDRGRAGSWPE